VAFVGFISNIRSLCTTYHWLAWLCKTPVVVISFVQGFLSTVLLAVLLLLVPIVLRVLARLEGIPQRTGVELSVMDRFFLFQVIVCCLLSLSLITIFSKYLTERLPGGHSFIWYHCFFTRLGESPDIRPDTPGSEFAKVLNILLDVRVFLELS
jgi:Calcium-dependent channel, 7TM region, putative phosphate